MKIYYVVKVKVAPEDIELAPTDGIVPSLFESYEDAQAHGEFLNRHEGLDNKFTVVPLYRDPRMEAFA